MMNDSSLNVLGCERCWPSAADAAWKARDGLALTAELIDESHYHVMILACPQCGQRFLSVFTERIDWSNGDDAQYWRVVPITKSEAAELIHRGSALTEIEINAVGSNRRSLLRSYPTGEGPREFWGTGITVGPHD
jgi:uncharacterized protein YbaR (Trm112 family)